MKIGIITDETDGQLVGFGNYTLELVRHILAQDKKNEYYLIHRRREQHDIYKMNAKEIIVPQRKFPLSFLRNFVLLPLAMRKHNLDVIHHVTSTGPFVFKRLNKAKTVETIHELLPLLYPKSFELPVRLVFRHLLPRIARNVDYIITSSERSKEQMIERFGIAPGKIEVIYPGVQSMFKPLSREKSAARIKKKYGVSNYILFVSTLEAKKNILTLLEAYKKLKAQGFTEKLVLVGRKGYGFEKIAARMHELGIEKDVVLPGYVQTEDLPHLYNAASVFASPSPDGFNLTAMDALACGCPCVLSRQGGTKEAFGDAVLSVAPFDSKAYADAIAKVLKSKTVQSALRKKGLARAKKFSWDAHARRTIAAYEKLGR